ncbi:hypothetical protein NY536_25605, partial [Enterobacter hormaechei]|nr:hypothetical protein [Enterobacter hormaechei]
YGRYREDPSSVDAGWRQWFDGLEGAVQHPSWQSSRWPLTDTDALTAALDPTQREPAPRPAKGGKPAAATAPAAPRVDVAKAAAGLPP